MTTPPVPGQWVDQEDLLDQHLYPQQLPVVPPVPTCATCLYFLSGITNTGADHSGGLCRRNVPLIVPNGWAIWPAVKTGDWCGEFKAATP